MSKVCKKEETNLTALRIALRLKPEESVFPAVNSRLAVDFSSLEHHVEAFSLLDGRRSVVVRRRCQPDNFSVCCALSRRNCGFEFQSKQYIIDGIPQQHVRVSEAHTCSPDDHLEFFLQTQNALRNLLDECGLSTDVSNGIEDLKSLHKRMHDTSLATDNNLRLLRHSLLNEEPSSKSIFSIATCPPVSLSSIECSVAGSLDEGCVSPVSMDSVAKGTSNRKRKCESLSNMAVTQSRPVTPETVEIPAKRRRGKPPKSKTAETMPTTIITVTPRRVELSLKKPRGRPPKKKSTATVPTTAINMKRRGGRPKKNSRATVPATIIDAKKVKKPSKKKWASTVATTIVKTPAPRNKLRYKVLLEDYQVLVARGKCVAIEFGNSLATAKGAVEETLARLKVSSDEDPAVLLEQKEFRKSMREMRRYEDAEKLSILHDRYDLYERIRKGQFPKKVSGRRGKEKEAELRTFRSQSIRFGQRKPGRTITVCDCVLRNCNICHSKRSERRPSKMGSLSPKVRLVEFFDLKDEEDDEIEEQTRDVTENSVIALKNLLYSLEFVESELESR